MKGLVKRLSFQSFARNRSACLSQQHRFKTTHADQQAPKPQIIFEKTNTVTVEEKIVVTEEKIQAAPKPEKKSKSKIFEELKATIPTLSDAEIVETLQKGVIGHYALEEFLPADRAVKIRRTFISTTQDARIASSMHNLPHEHYKFDQVKGVCCENVIGYVPIPVGVVGPFLIDGKEFLVPMATTEGALIASTHRGAKAISMSGGANTVVVNDGMTRAPVVQMPSAKAAGAVKAWLENPDNYAKVETIFNSTSRFAKLREIKTTVAGRKIFIRFKCLTGDAMGMNMITKATNAALKFLHSVFEDMEILGLSGNMCTDKKPSAINWIEGRGKSVVCDTVISKDIVQSVLKTNVDSLVSLNVDKNLVGSAMAGSIGGFNAHASNIVTAIFLATGQDCAQNVESSNCVTLMEKDSNGDLYMSVSMPSIEVGTVGGGTHLAPQAACLDMLGVRGANQVTPGANAQLLARVVCATVMAGELSLMCALASNNLLSAHMALNRK